MARHVSAREAFDLIQNEGFQLLDVRSIPEFEAGHPAGALNVPLGPELVGVVERLFPDKGTKLVLSCLGGKRSMQALTALEARGYTSLVDQRAGWGGVRDAFGRVSDEGWQAAGLPTETGAGGERSYAALRAR